MKRDILSVIPLVSDLESSMHQLDSIGYLQDWNSHFQVARTYMCGIRFADPALDDQRALSYSRKPKLISAGSRRAGS